MTLDDLDNAARKLGLAVRGAFHPSAEDQTPSGTQTLVMIGPDEPAFWQVFTTSPEFQDGAPNPLDRWSQRVSSVLAAPYKATPVFPYDGPPYPPFLRWAERCGAIWSSPVNLLVHEHAGLFISFRAALAVPLHFDLPPPPTKPCTTCDRQPCTTACPVGALAPGQDYDVPACKSHMQSPEGADCRNGCLVRRACPVSQRFGRVPEQSAFHMRAFLGQ